MARWLAASWGITLGAASATSAQGTGPVTAELTAQRVRQGAVAWTPERRLTWRDFPSPVPAGDAGAARLTTGLLYATACEGSTFLFAVEAAFVPGSSWVAPRVLLDSAVSARVLTHEQIHFDLSESVARELRQALAALPDPCRELGRGIPALFEEFTARERALQERYDGETGHGTLRDRQHEWEARTGARLDSLKGFAASSVRRTP